ncbi:MAG: App1 family protein [Propionibacteriaceae bacterium]
MSDRPFFARRLERWTNRHIEAGLKLFGWREAVVAYTGYGSQSQLRVMGRVVLAPPNPKDLGVGIDIDIDEIMRQRGWRNFLAQPCTHAQVRVQLGEQIIATVADEDGYFDLRVPQHGLEPGWHTITIKTPYSAGDEARILVVSDNATFGVISDIDDTVISTLLPRPLIAAWNSFVLPENARKPVEGMADLFQSIEAKLPDTPVFYISTGSWDTSDFLHRFLTHNGYPDGPMLLSDWGPTNTGWFRSGTEHKRRALRELARDLPNIRWLLIGDDGQHDPHLYREFANDHPTKVRAIAIRELTSTEHVLAHGYPTAIGEESVPVQAADIPEARAPHGHGLAQLLLPVISQDNKMALTPDTPRDMTPPTPRA